MDQTNVNKLNQDQESSTYCPLTGVRVLEYGSKQFSISGVTVTWWHCVACNGWHLLTSKMNPEKESAEVKMGFQSLTL